MRALLCGRRPTRAAAPGRFFRLLLIGYFEGLDQRANFFRETVQRIEAVPGVTAAGAASRIPFSEALSDTRTTLTIEGRPTDADARPTIGVNVVTPSYFRVMGIAVVRRRTFGPADLRETTPVAVVNETMARHFWSDDDPVGKRIRCQ